MSLYLRDDLQAALAAGAIGDPRQGAFELLYGVSGQVFRLAERRRTLRFVAAGKAYFAKLHGGVGWGEIVKNVLVGKRPVLGAGNEFEACRRLAANGVRVPAVAAFGERGRNPARRESFLVCDALDGYADMESIADGCPPAPLSLAVKRRLIAAAGELARRMHDAGVQHRDFYLCHLFADAAALGRGDAELALIDLHRACVRERTTARQRSRDLGALLHSAAAAPLSRTDLLRFVAAYAEARPAGELRRGGHFWRAAQQRSERLRRRAAAKGLASGDAALTHGADGAASVSSLSALGRVPPLPFRFDADFGDGGVRVVCTQLMRIQPGRRFVARATLHNGELLALKAFYGRRTRRDLNRERRGIAAIAASGVATPELLRCGAGAGGRLLAFQYLADARAPGREDLPALMGILARLHERGVRQRDLHVGNFLVQGGRVFAIDGGGVRRALCRRRSCWRDAARLLASMPGDADCVAQAAAEYAAARGWPTNSADAARLASMLARARRRRAAAWMAKTVRDCTPFAVRRTALGLVAVAREDDDAALREFIADPEAAMARGAALKRGRTATVARCGDLVVKRYSVKDSRHRWRLKLRSTRARRAWRAGHGLALLGIPTVRPRALIECRDAPVGGAVAYLAMDCAPGVPLADAIAAEGLTEPLRQGLRALFRALRAGQIGHGDMKPSNFVVDGGTVRIVDLDAARVHRSRETFLRRHRRDLARFLRDWPEEQRQALRALLQDP